MRSEIKNLASSYMWFSRRALPGLAGWMLASMLLTLSLACRDATVAEAQRKVARIRDLYSTASFRQIYAEGGPEFRATPEADILTLFETVTTKLGTLQSSQLSGFRTARNSNREFVFLGYRSRFEKGEANEEFAFKSNNGTVELAGYKINSKALSDQVPSRRLQGDPKD